MIVNVNKCASMFDETFHVFKFSAIAKQVCTERCYWIVEMVMTW